MVVVDLAPGLPGVQLVGLPDKAIQELRERVRSALRNSGFRGPLVHVVINLAPADLRKEGPSFDLPIALALLVASGAEADRSHRSGGTRALGTADQPAWAEHAQQPSTVARGAHHFRSCLLYTSPSPRDAHESRMPSSA